MSQKYEVLRFTEQGGSCRQGLDCLEGVVLADFIGECPCMEKEELFRLFAGLGVELGRYRKANGGKGLRLVNPYSILLTDEGMFLLNMDSPDNEPLLRKMQGRELRSRFLRPLYEGGAREMSRGDLFGYGRTMQFMLACTHLSPPLTSWERRRMSRVVSRCTGEKGHRYEEPKEAVEDIPKGLGWQDSLRGKVVKMSATVVILSSVALILLGILLSPVVRDRGNQRTGGSSLEKQNTGGQNEGEQGQNGQSSEDQDAEDQDEGKPERSGQSTEKQNADRQDEGEPERSGQRTDNQSATGWRADGQNEGEQERIGQIADNQSATGWRVDGQNESEQGQSGKSADNQSVTGWRVDGQNTVGQNEGSQSTVARYEQESALRERMESVINILSRYGHEDTGEGTVLLTRYGKELRLRCAWLMARTYEREGMTEAALDEYILILLQEERKDRLLLASKRKMELEIELGRYEQAIRTGENMQKLFGTRAEITQAIEQCKEIAGSDSGAQQ